MDDEQATAAVQRRRRSGAVRVEVPDGDDPTLEDVAELGGRSLLGLVALVVGALPFLALLALVETRWPPLQRLDTGVADALNARVATSPLTVQVLGVLTDAGGGAAATFVLTLVAVCLVVRRHVDLAAYLAVAGIGLGILSPVTKALVGRPRPDVPLPVVELPTNASFPSGHAMTAAVTWGALLLVALPSLRPSERRAAVAVAAALVLTVGFTRLALGVHFVSDVVAGWGLGLAWLAVVTAGFRRWRRARGRRVVPVGAGVLTGRVSDGRERALPDGGRTLARLAAGWVAAAAAVVVVRLAATGLGGAAAGDPVRGAGVVGRSLATTLGDAVLVLAAPPGVLMTTLAGAALGAASRRSWRPVVVVVAAVVGGVLLHGATAAVVRVVAGAGGLGGGTSAAGVGSGHVVAVTAALGGIALVVATSTRRRWRWAAPAGVVVVVALVALARVHVAGDRPSDVVVGALVGGLWLAVLHRVVPAAGGPAGGPAQPPAADGAAPAGAGPPAPGHTRRVVRRRLVVSGVVQGVGFRWACAREAEQAGVRGWVRNRPDGAVEIAAEGDPDAVRRLVEWAHTGPRHARVTTVDVVDEAPEGVDGFAILH